MIWQFGKVFSGCRIWSGTGTDPFLGAVLVPGLRVFCWLWRWLSRLLQTSAALVFKSFFGK